MFPYFFKKIICEIILNLGQWFKRCHLKIFFTEFDLKTKPLVKSA